MGLRKLAVPVLAALLLVGCSNEAAPAADRVREVASSSGASRIGLVMVSPTAVQVTYLGGDKPMVATKTSGDVTTVPGQAALLTRPVGVDELGLDDFTARLAERKGCPDGTWGTINVTHGGAVVQQVGCSDPQGGKLKDSYLDGTALKPIEAWNDASLTSQLEELRALVGDQAMELGFYTPRSTSVDPSFRAMAVSAPITGVDGKKCFVQARRAGTMPADGIGWINYQGCEAATPLGETPFAISELSAAKILAALERGAAKLKIDVDDFGDFTVISTKGRLTVQMKVAQGVSAQSPVWAEPID